MLAAKRAACDGEVVDESTKKAKLDNAATAFQHVSSFGDFKPRRILSEDARTKFMAVEGTFGGDASDSAAAVVVVEKTPFSRENYELVFTADTKLEETFHNDVYTSYGGKLSAALNGRPSKLWEETNPDWAPTLLLGYSTCHEDPAPYDRMNIERLQKDEADVAAVVESIGTGSNNAVEGQPPSEDESHMERNKPGLTATVICPATQKHVDKYLFKPQHMITETPKLYKEVTEPYITSQQLSLQWVYNILEHKKESERILFEDPDPETGFILLPDMKWDTKQPENLYVLAICHKHGIRSLRDLTADHLSLLRNINEKVKAALLLQFGVPSHRLRGYLHYQPSYYHLHVHFSVLGFDAPGTQVERAHLLSTVISNLEAFPDYYQKATLGFTVKEGDGLHAKYKEAGYFD
uniref:m7GpppX diphosphatase n=1 Tax=Rhipicephalus zambeziensis TaxID=60191 RepID=A0A224Z3V5_9ACAR